MKSLWSDEQAPRLKGLDILVYTSRLIGANPNLVMWGGGNSSVKIPGKDHAERPCRILWMKGSGSDMKTITPRQFTPLRLDDLLLLLKRDAMSDEEMVDYQSRCVLRIGAPKPSIETLLHAFLPAAHIYHTHADAICTLTDTPHTTRHIEAVYGKGIAIVPYYRPGFMLSKLTAEAYAKNPKLRAIVLDKHGLITWGATAKEAYLETIRMVSQAERYIATRSRKRPALRKGIVNKLPLKRRRAIAAAVAPVLRGQISRDQRMLLFYDDDPKILQFVNSLNGEKLSQIGPFTPDHLLHTKPWPLFLALKNPEPEFIQKSLPGAVERYRKRYRTYFERYRTPGVTLLDPNPRVILIPGLGMFTTGKDRRACRMTHDLYRHTIEVIQQSNSIESYRSLSLHELCDFEYWPLENFKLTLLPPEKELSRRIVLVTGAAGGIGRAVSTRLAKEGAMVILADIDIAQVRKVAGEINEETGEIHAMAIRMDVTDEASVRNGFREAVLAYGGLDVLVSNAGIARTSSVQKLLLADWMDAMAVNATGHFLVCREALLVYGRQGIGGNIVVVASKNVLAPGKDFGAYSASKAAQVQLSRIMAIEGAKDKIRTNMVNPDGVFESSGLWSPRIREERARAHGIQVDQLEDFYAQRNLLKSRILPNDVAEAVLFFASERSAKTTGAILPVDGGLREAFPR
jgi:rhamnulose-1-phosphate aldolase/alcohol dehydrogenase